MCWGFFLQYTSCSLFKITMEHLVVCCHLDISSFIYNWLMYLIMCYTSRLTTLNHKVKITMSHIIIIILKYQFVWFTGINRGGCRLQPTEFLSPHLSLISAENLPWLWNLKKDPKGSQKPVFGLFILGCCKNIWCCNMLDCFKEDLLILRSKKNNTSYFHEIILWNTLNIIIYSC